MFPVPVVLRACVVTASIALLSAAASFPHMAFKRGEPAPDSQLAAAPTRIALWFTGRPQLPFSRIDLTGPGGPVALDAIVADTGNGLRAAVRGALPPGAYRVAWQTAGADGHRLSGDYGFTFLGPGLAATTGDHSGHATPASAATQHMVSHTPSVAARVARWWEYFALLATFGVLAFVHLVLPPLAARGVPTSDASASARRIGEVVVVIYLAAAAYRLIAQLGAAAAMAPDGQGPSVAYVLRGSTWGQGWLIGATGAGVLLAGLLIARRRVAIGTPLALTGALGMALSPALSGHAAAAPQFMFAVALDTVHVAAIGTWIGGLLIVLLVGVPAMARLTDGNPDAAVSALVNSFHPIALVSAPLAVFAGVGSAFRHVTTVSALSTPYGRTLLVKLGLFAVVAAVGAYNSTRARKRLGTPQATKHLRASATAELVLASLVLAATTILTSSPLPMDGTTP